MFSGFINFIKPIGESSAHALSAVKKVLRIRGIDTKVGHLGTLDPLACGVLPVALGRATRLFDYSLSKKKTYIAEFTFGVTSETFDLGSETVAVDGETVTEEKIRAVLPSFLGKQNQIPPSYSAKSVNGVRSYVLARQGIACELAPKEITIHRFDLTEKVADNTYKFEIECSSGTYIRSLARDLGERLRTAAVMSALRRIQSGRFSIDNGISPEELLLRPEELEKYVLPTDYLLSDLPKAVVNNEQKRILCNGLSVAYDGEKIQRVYCGDTLLGLGEVTAKKMRIKTWLI